MGRIIPPAADAAAGSAVVTVVFRYTSPSQVYFSNTPDPVTMVGSGNIVFQLSNDSTPGAQLTDFYVENNPNWRSVFDSKSISQNGRAMTVHNNNTLQPGQPQVSYDYVLTIAYNGIIYYDDPVIDDEPPPNQWVKVPTLSPASA